MSAEIQNKERNIIFPLRTADYATYLATQEKPQPIELSEEERKQLIEYEAELYKELSPTFKKMVGIHTIFPEYLTTDEGWQTAQNIYSAENHEIFNTPKPQSLQEAIDIFNKLRIYNIDKKSRSEIEAKSLIYAREKFIAGIDKNTNPDDLEDPVTASRVYNPQTLIQKAQELREFKRKLKAKREENTQNKTQTNLEIAKEIIDRIYQRYINVRLAVLYDDAFVALNDPAIPEEDKEQIRKLFPGHNTDNKDRRIRTLARIEKFYQGVDRKEGSSYFPIISESIASAIEQKMRIENQKGNELYQEHQIRKIDANKYQEIANAVLDRIGATQAGWRTEICENPGVALDHRRKLYFIPENYDRNLPETIQSIAHEAEVHIWRDLNKSKLPLKLLKYRNTGRIQQIAESAAVFVEEETMRRVYGRERQMTGTYYIIMREREKGRSFKHCVMALVREGKDPETAFTSAWRVFKKGRIPLNDPSRHIVNTEELAYHEPVAERLAKLDLSKLLFVSAVDIYTYQDLVRIGMLPIEEIEEPQFITAEVAFRMLLLDSDQQNSHGNRNNKP
ncbi:MAG: DUF1704 domain-containing protein [Patescibacteria group bacterium]|nr:DUF1704 domain-containing protein [Patescibacteria group bacterium]